MPDEAPSDAKKRNRPAGAKPEAAPFLSPCRTCKVRKLGGCLPAGEEELVAVTQVKSTVKLERHQSLFAEGDPARHVFTVMDGVMRVYKLLPDGRRQITGFLYPGDFLGLPNGEVYAYSAEAVCDAVLCQFPRDKLITLLNRFAKMEQRLLAGVQHELAVAQDQVMVLGRKSARERVASFLIMTSERAARRGQSDNPVSLPMTRSDVADYLGLTMETVSRVVNRFKREGIINSRGSDIEITEREMLREIADGE